MPHIRINQLHAGYGATKILKGVDLAVARGEFVALLGASGCGKTTLLRTISGFGAAQSGQVLKNGADITTMPPEKRQMAFMFQNYALWSHMTVQQHLAYGLKLRRASVAQIKAKLDDLVALLGLEGLLQRKPAALSGGQKQRVALGRALAIDPEILLLDEPLSNLDARIRIQLRDELRALQQRLGITAILVTHDREEAMVMADKIVILNKGRIEQQGSPEEIYNHPATPYVAAFMGAENCLELDQEGGAILGDEAWEAFTPQAVLPDGPIEARFRAQAAEINSTKPAASGDLSAKGIVKSRSYPGGIWSYRISLGHFSIEAMSSEQFEPGQTVSLTVRADNLFLFAANPTPAAPLSLRDVKGHRDQVLLPA